MPKKRYSVKPMSLVMVEDPDGEYVRFEDICESCKAGVSDWVDGRRDDGKNYRYRRDYM